MNLILASNSPRRRELLNKLNYPYEIIPSICEEKSTATAPKDIAIELACQKALDVFKSHPDCVVIGCDTVVDLNGTLMGKPKDFAHAVGMLQALSGNTHQVHTGVCVMCKAGVWLFAESTNVTFVNLSVQQIEDYVNSGSAYDKAGAYGIQDSGFVCAIQGDYDNVVGFPTNRVHTVLQQIYKR